MVEEQAAGGGLLEVKGGTGTEGGGRDMSIAEFVEVAKGIRGEEKELEFGRLPVYRGELYAAELIIFDEQYREVGERRGWWGVIAADFVVECRRWGDDHPDEMQELEKEVEEMT